MLTIYWGLKPCSIVSVTKDLRKLHKEIKTLYLEISTHDSLFIIYLLLDTKDTQPIFSYGA